MEEQRPIIRALESARIVGFRLWGIGAILLSMLGMLTSMLILIVTIISPAERTAQLVGSFLGVLVCALFLRIGIRAVRVSKEELRDAPKQLSDRRDQLEAWINKPRRRDDV